MIGVSRVRFSSANGTLMIEDPPPLPLEKVKETKCGEETISLYDWELEFQM